MKISPHDHPDCHTMVWTDSEIRWIEARIANVEANYESAVQRLNEKQLLCNEAIDALCAAQRYGAGDWSDLIRRLEE